MIYFLMRYCLIIAFLWGLTTGCNEHTNTQQKTVEAPQDVVLETQESLSLILKQNTDSLLIIDSTALITFRYFKTLYKEGTPLWFTKANLNDNGDSLMQLLSRAAFYGLHGPDYHQALIKTLQQTIRKEKRINTTAIAKMDVLLTDAYFLLGAHLNKGRLYPDSLCLNFNKQFLKPAWDSILIEGFKHNTIRNALEELEPKQEQYQLLKQELQKILTDSSFYAVDSIPFASIKDTSVIQASIKNYLLKLNLYDTTSVGNDSVKLAKALVKFQKKWYLQPDGQLGKYTQQALSYTREKIIQQLSMSMERWRWEAGVFPKKYAFINIPAFEIYVVEEDSIMIQSRIVCGKPETPTPLLTSKINYMLIYPYWNVPYTIAWKEMLPTIQRDTSYLRKKNFEVIDRTGKVVDYTKLPWRKYSKDYLPVKFRQRIGTENSLGIVKFNFNNPYGVYLHDTNSKRYFKTSSRAQSHGCIRLEKYIEMADFLIKEDSLRYTHDSLMVYFSKQEQRKLPIKKPLPIYTRYYTAWVDRTGLKLYLDIYRKDEEMAKLIYQK